jgi:TetR/AcrR family tetracycline transcriptional repressor
MPPRSPRAPLSRERFIAAAWDFIEANGLDALTMRSLGKAMGVSASAVYTYFPEREGLVAALADEILGRAAPADPTLSPRGRLEDEALRIREVMRQHPAIGRLVASSPVESPTAAAFAIRIIHDLEELGLTGDDLVTGYRLFEGYVAGMSLFDLAGAPEHLEQRRRRYRSLSHAAFDEHSRSEGDIDRLNEDVYAHGLRVLLDHLESLSTRG